MKSPRQHYFLTGVLSWLVLGLAGIDKKRKTIWTTASLVIQATFYLTVELTVGFAVSISLRLQHNLEFSR